MSEKMLRQKHNEKEREERKRERERQRLDKMVTAQTKH